MASGPFDHFPDDLILKVLQYLRFEDLRTVSLVNDRFSRLCDDRTLVR